ncbi:MAG: hypothetical protein WBO45_13480 [Planctomycetota bacterium]
MRRSSFDRTALRSLLLLAVLALTTGCSLLVDEFGWLDRAAPRSPAGAGTAERP